MKNLQNPIFKNLIQVGMVVPDLNTSIKKYVYDYNLGPVYVLEFNSKNVQNMQLYGNKKNYSMNLGVCSIGDVRFELIEPISESIYSDYLNKYRDGVIHHLKLGVENYFEAIEHLKSCGINIIQHGEQLGDNGKNIYTYLDTRKSLGFIIEIVQVTSDFIKPKPDYWFPSIKELRCCSIFKKVNRFGLVVNNLESKIDEYRNTFGLNPVAIKVFNQRNIDNMHIFNRKKNYEFKAGFFTIGNKQIILIEPLSESIYSEFLNKYGTGVVHHLNIEVENYDESLNFLKSRGLSKLQSGNYLNQLRFCYLSMNTELSFILEINESKKGIDFLP